MKWYNYFKYDIQGRKCYPQLTYEPLISYDKKKFCMNFHPDNEYQKFKTFKNRPNYSRDNILFFFENEIKFLDKVKNEKFAPKNVDIDYKNYRIYFDWYKISCNQYIQENKDIWPKDEWFSKLEQIIAN
jgi:hypothetical protein